MECEEQFVLEIVRRYVCGEEVQVEETTSFRSIPLRFGIRCLSVAVPSWSTVILSTESRTLAGTSAPFWLGALALAVGFAIPFVGQQTQGARMIPEDDLTAATIALTAMRRGIEAADTTSGFVVSPSVTVLSLDEAASVLAIMEKPISCSARVAGGAIHVDCSHQLDESSRLLLERQVESANSGRGVWGKAISILERISAARAVVRDDTRIIPASSTALRAYVNQFLLTSTHAAQLRVRDGPEGVASASIEIALASGSSGHRDSVSKP